MRNQTIMMTFITEFDDKNLDDAVFHFRDLPTEKRYLDINLKRTSRRFVQNPNDDSKFAVVAEYVSYETDETTECPKRKLPAPDTNS